MKRIMILTGLTIALLTGCDKSDTETPHCITRKIDDFDKNAPCNNPNVEEYKFQGDRVFVFNPGTCGADMTSDVFDEDCKLLGSLGGFMGNTKINGEDFSKATFVKTIWKR